MGHIVRTYPKGPSTNIMRTLDVSLGLMILV